MLSPLLNNAPALPEGPSPDAADTPSAFLEPGRFAQLLTSCLKSSMVSGEPVPTPDVPKKGSSGSSFSSLALLALLQGTGKDPLKGGMKEAGEDDSPEGLLCPRSGGVFSTPLPLPEETTGFPILSEISLAASSELSEKELPGTLLPPAEFPPAEEKSVEEDGSTPVDSLLSDSAPLFAKDSAGDENLVPVQEKQAGNETPAAVPAPVVVPGQETISVSGTMLSEVREISSGKKISGDALLRKEGIPVPPSGDAGEEKKYETVPSLETGEGKNSAAKDLRNGGENRSSSGEEEERLSLSEKALSAVKNQGQENSRKPLEFSSTDRDAQKEPQSVRSRDGDSAFASLLRPGSSAEAKGVSAASRGAEVPLSSRNGDALGEGMTNVVRFLRRDGLHRASIVVEPPALGRVEIELSSTAGGVEASIRVGSEQLRQLVQDQLNVLRNSLSQQGVQMTSCTVDIGDSRMDQDEKKDNGQREKVHTARSVSDQREETLSFRVDLEQGLLYWMA